MEKKILVIDIETTGFSHTKNHITEIGICELNLENGERKMLFDKVVYEPEMNFREAFIRSKLSGLEFSLSIFDNAVNFEKQKEEIQEIINQYPEGATAYNNKFDFGFLESRGFTFPKKLACPMLLSTNVCKIPKARGSGYKWPKVQEAWNFFFGTETGYIETHRGGDDAYHEALIVYELYKREVFVL